MSTLHRIREFALVAALGVGALVASATLACEQPMIESRDAAAANLGSMTVTAPRLPATYGSFADLGSMTVTAPRAAEVRLADLGGMTVQASRIKTVAVAARPEDRAFN